MWREFNKPSRVSSPGVDKIPFCKHPIVPEVLGTVLITSDIETIIASVSYLLTAVVSLYLSLGGGEEILGV